MALRKNIVLKESNVYNRPSNSPNLYYHFAFKLHLIEISIITICKKTMQMIIKLY